MSAVLSHPINADGVPQHVNELLSTIQDQLYYPGNMLNAQRIMRDEGSLAHYLLSRFSASFSVSLGLPAERFPRLLTLPVCFV